MANSIIVNCKKHGETQGIMSAATQSNPSKPRCCKCSVKHLESKAKGPWRDAAGDANALAKYCEMLPERYRAASYDNYNVSNDDQAEKLGLLKRYVGRFDSNEKNIGGLFVLGTPGNGKTHLLISTGKEIARLGKNVVYRNFYDIADEVKSTWGQSSVSASEVYQRYITPELLIVDEVGESPANEHLRAIAFKVINGRYEKLKPTIIISNLTIEQIGEHISERSVGRIQERGGVLTFTWESYREVA